MSAQWTAVHEFLGLSFGELTFGDLDRAITADMPESDHFDWKKALPYVPAPGRWNEFCKDVTAMANTRGGLLVYGVSDAIEYEGIDVAVARQQVATYAQWLRNHVQPYLAGVDFAFLEPQPATGKGLMLVHVPASPAAPHLVYGGTDKEKSQLAFVPPWRDRDHTAWMSQAQLERAYADRFARADQIAVDLREAAEVVDGVIGEDEVWVVVTARPIQPPPGLAPALERDQVRGVLARALAESAALRGKGRSGLDVLKRVSSLLNIPRRGLRSWAVSNRGIDADHVGERGLYIELGHSGTLVFAAEVTPEPEAPVHNPPDEECRVVSAEVIDHAIGEAVTSAQSLGRQLGTAGGLGLRARLETGLLDIPMWCAALDGRGTNRISTTSRRVRRARAVESGVDVHGDLDATRVAVADLSGGVLHQFGVEPPFHS
ncbi:ATP-binding protein [Phytomonospora sp. NPDC050363]|uniref:AlbA family DNA-binding domain-containing protein n=1 Tax=Phytomonospora sp. NPDC050363 TaxID=3155642 RepID=UPI0033EFD0E5